MWTAEEFASRHNHALHGARAEHAARQANAILRSGAPEGIAIATANKYEQTHRDTGGGIMGYQAGGAPLTPSLSTVNPITQSLIQRYSSLPTEKLQELAAMLGGSTQQGQLVQSILHQRQMMPNATQQPSTASAPQQPQQQPQLQPQPQPPVSSPLASGSSPVQVRRGGTVPKRDMGGSMLGLPLSQADPWYERQEAYNTSRMGSGTGFLMGGTGGRTDAVKTQAPPGSYVLPADVVAGLGEGNSLAGARVATAMFETGPYGIPMPRGARGRGPPRPPPAPRLFDAKGGGVQGKPGEGGMRPVALSHGEVVLSPQAVLRQGKGDPKYGYKVLDNFVKERRKIDIAKLKRLPGPVQPGERG